MYNFSLLILSPSGSSLPKYNHFKPILSSETKFSIEFSNNNCCICLLKYINNNIILVIINITNRYINYVVIIDDANNTLINKRTEKGIWHNLYEFPNIETELELDFETISNLISTKFSCCFTIIIINPQILSGIGLI